MQLQGYPIIAIAFRDDENEVQYIHTVFADDHGKTLIYDFNWTPARTCYRYDMAGYGANRMRGIPIGQQRVYTLRKWMEPQSASM